LLCSSRRRITIWHAGGSNFRDYHLLFDEQAESLLGSIDTLAERMRRIGATTIRSIQHIAGMQTIHDDNSEFVSPERLIQTLIVAPDTDVTDAADLMASQQIRRLPVVDDGQLIGMISLGDIAVKPEESTAAHALEGVSEGVKASSAARGARAATELRPKVDAESAAATPPRTASHKKESKARRKPPRRAA
jgi:predicted transcriptional regulator